MRDKGWNGPSAIRLRLGASLHVLQLALRRHVTRTLRGPVAFEGIPGAIDRIEIRNGQMKVSGWTTAGAVLIATDQGARHVDTAASLQGAGCATPRRQRERGRFDIQLAGTDCLLVEAGEMRALSLCLIRAWDRWRAAAHLGGNLVRLPIRQGRDLLAFALRGDSAAGYRLERALLRDPVPRPQPWARPGLLRATPAAPVDERIDIVVLVPRIDGGAAERLARLLRLVPPGHRVVLIGAGPEGPGIRALLDDTSKRHAIADEVAIDVASDPAAAASRFIRASRRHVVLLRGDVHVPKDWLPGLVRPILTDPAVASVRPVSDIAGTRLLPSGWPAPDGQVSFDALDRVARSLDPGLATFDTAASAAPCMALSRGWLDRASGYDAGSILGLRCDSDWCARVSAMGGRQVQTAAVYVACASDAPARSTDGSPDRGTPPPRRCSADGDDAREVDVPFGPRLAFAMGLMGSGHRVPVYLAHRLGGGSEHWLAARLRSGRACVVLRPADETGWVRVEVHGSTPTVAGDVPVEDLRGYLALLAGRHLVYSCLVDPGDPMAIAAAAVDALGPNDRFDMLFHDYFPLCPSYDLIGAQGAFCELPEADACQDCYARLVRLTGRRPATIAEWRARWQTLVARADRVTVFSEASRDLVLRVWPEVESRLGLEPHLPDVLPRPVAAPDPPLPVVGVLGSIGHAKGGGVLLDLASHGGGRLRIVVIGALDPRFRHPGIRVHGSYDRRDISDLAERYRIDRWFIPAIWPETFSYTTHECLATGLPVFAFNLGAQGETVARAGNGRVLPFGLRGEALVEALTG